MFKSDKKNQKDPSSRPEDKPTDTTDEKMESKLLESKSDHSPTDAMELKEKEQTSLKEDNSPYEFIHKAPIPEPKYDRSGKAIGVKKVKKKRKQTDEVAVFQVGGPLIRKHDVIVRHCSNDINCCCACCLSDCSVRRINLLFLFFFLIVILYFPLFLLCRMNLMTPKL